MKVGDKLPDTLGRDHTGREIRLADLAGRRFILAAYPKAGTAGCTAEACSLEAHREELGALGYEIIGVSRDSAAAQTRFAERNHLGFPLIADTDTALLRAIDAWGTKTMCGRTTEGTLRTTLLVDEQGRVAAIFTPKQIKTAIHAEQVIDTIRGL